MAFIDKTDIIKALHGEYLDEITRNDELIIKAGIDAAISEMKAYLANIYDVQLIFSATGNNRNALLVEFAVDIAIYNIVEIDRPGIDMEDRRARYKRAIDWLKQVRDGNLNADLPLLDNTEENKNPILYGSLSKRKNHY